MEPWEQFLTNLLKDHSGEIEIFLLSCVVMVTLLIIIPQLLRANMRKSELRNQERLRALEHGIPLPAEDERTRVAGRTALLVPAISIVTAGTVTSFLVVYKTENLFAVSLAIWVVSGTISLAAITGGVALIGQMARLQAGEQEEEELPEESSIGK